MLSKAAEYAIRAMVYIRIKNDDGERPGIEEIALNIEAPQAFTAKVLQTLSKHKLVDSMKGRGGGFFFTEAHRFLNLLDIVEVIEGKSLFTKCGFGLKTCSDDLPCPLHKGYKQLINGFHHLLSTASLSNVANEVRSGKTKLNRLKLA
jgi:Rrf2 family protein